LHSGPAPLFKPMTADAAPGTKPPTAHPSPEELYPRIAPALAPDVCALRASAGCGSTDSSNASRAPPTPTYPAPRANASRSSTPRSTTGCCDHGSRRTTHPPQPNCAPHCTPSTGTSTATSTTHASEPRHETQDRRQRVVNKGSLRRVRDFARKRWPLRGSSGRRWRVILGFVDG
jgi:hypothetical protein